ncbi:MAG: hypothetical protein JW751_11845 [Polyangiaceae bacterium]|nr:hypothetical protein [Polyangiaceae bacterium]
MQRISYFVGAATLVLLTATACRDREACERSRMKMQQTWADLKNTAAKQKVPTTFEDLSEADKANRMAQWSPIEEKAELLRSSFETKQITWNAADKAREELNSRASTIDTEGKPLLAGFSHQLQTANAAYDQMQKDCR